MHTRGSACAVEACGGQWVRVGKQQGQSSRERQAHGRSGLVHVQ